MAKPAKPKTYTLATLTGLVCREKSWLFRRSKKEAWPYIIKKVPSGQAAKHYKAESLPADIRVIIENVETREKLKEHGIETETPFDHATVERTAISYADAPAHNRKKLDKYATVLHLLKDFHGRELKRRIKDWNQDHPEMITSYPRVMAARKAKREHGLDSLLGKFGKAKGRCIVPDEPGDYFNSLYLKECGPGAKSCWLVTVGKFCNPENPGYIPLEKFPSEDSFMRRLKRKVGESATYLARHGFAKWNRKYASYIERDYTKIGAGEIWVSDHAQIDVAVKSGNTNTSINTMKRGRFGDDMMKSH